MSAGKRLAPSFKVPWQIVLHATAYYYPNASLTLEEVGDKYPSLFHDEVEKALQHKAQLNVPVNAKPIFLYVLRETTEQELQRLQRLGAIVPVENSDWAAMVVPVVKLDGSVFNLHLAVNKTATNVYQLPGTEDLFVSLLDSPVPVQRTLIFYAYR